MTRKQKKVLYRIIAAFALLIILQFIPAEGWFELALYLIPYLVIGYDILRKAALGIIHGEVFDENFLMSIASSCPSSSGSPMLQSESSSSDEEIALAFSARGLE